MEAAATAVGLAPAAAWDFIVATVMFGGVLGVIYLLTRRRAPGARVRTPATRRDSLLRRIAVAEAWRLSRGGPLPYAVAIAIGGCIILLNNAGA